VCRCIRIGWGGDVVVITCNIMYTLYYGQMYICVLNGLNLRRLKKNSKFGHLPTEVQKGKRNVSKIFTKYAHFLVTKTSIQNFHNVFLKMAVH
jgi:hypothetical protein